MNKLLGFYELKDSNLPTIPWKEYTGEQDFDPMQLWTLRTAVYKGNDLNLPRFVGINSHEASKRARELYETYKNKGIVIYYPYFVAEKSGTLNVYSDKVVIEAVKDDLWNLVTYSNRDVTVIQNTNQELNFIGDRNFLDDKEISEILSFIPVVRSMFKDYMAEGKSVLLEWSFAYNCDTNKNKIDDKYFVFYEARVI